MAHGEGEEAADSPKGEGKPFKKGGSKKLTNEKEEKTSLSGETQLPRKKRGGASKSGA